MKSKSIRMAVNRLARIINMIVVLALLASSASGAAGMANAQQSSSADPAQFAANSQPVQQQVFTSDEPLPILEETAQPATEPEQTSSPAEASVLLAEESVRLAWDIAPGLPGAAQAATGMSAVACDAVTETNPVAAAPSLALPSPTAILTDTTDSSTPLGAGKIITPTLMLTSAPGFVIAGRRLNLIWSLEGWNGKEASSESGDTASAAAGGEENLTLTWKVPAGFVPVEPYEGAFAAETGQFVQAVEKLSGQMQWLAPEWTPGPFVFALQLQQNGEQLFETSLELEEKSLSQVDASGGTAEGLDGRVKVRFPAGATAEAIGAETLLVRVAEVDPEKELPYSFSGRPFELLARSESSALEVRRFSQPVTITVQYTDSQVQGDEQFLRLYYFDEAVQDWQPLPTFVDMQANRLSALSDHFSVFDFNAQDWEAARLPTLANFRVSQFTGAASYSFPIQVPLGPAGLQPSLALSYNSQVVESASSTTQASWVGMGWSLDTGYIQRNQNSTSEYYGAGYDTVEGNARMDDDWRSNGSGTSFTGTDGDDTFSLVVNGQSWTLLRIPDTDNNENTIDYRTAEESYWRVRRYHAHAYEVYWGNISYWGDNSYWEVWDKQGNKYRFETRAKYPAYIPNQCSAPFMQTWQWSLTYVESIFGQRLNYEYETELDEKANPQPGCSSYNANMQVAVYPKQIIYPNQRYRLVFERKSRSDYVTSWDNVDYYVLYKRSLLDSIKIWHDPDGVWNNGNEALIRKYVLGHGQGIIFPNVTWTGGGKTPALTSITEYGLGGLVSLPATTFTYDGMHLTEADNGYGGKETFVYDLLAWHEMGSAADPFSFIPQGEANWIYPATGQYRCQDTANYDLPISTPAAVFHPGQVYKFSIRLHSPCLGDYNLLNPTNFGIWLSSNGANRLEATEGKQVAYESATTGTVTGYLQVPDETGFVQFFIKVGANAVLYEYKVWSVTTRYRVVSESTQDLVSGQTASLAYAYDEPATNDATHSSYIQNNPNEALQYTKAYSEFRGHAMARQTNADGLVTTTFFYQDDARRGQAAASLTGTNDYWRSFEALDWNQFLSEWTYIGAAPAPERENGDTAIKVNNPNPVWNTALSRIAQAVGNGEGVMVQFKTSASGSGLLAIDNVTWGTGYRRFGLLATPGSGVYGHYCINTTCTTETTPLFNAADFKSNTWYVLILLVDDTNDRLLARLWQRDNPAMLRDYSRDMDDGIAWRFTAQPYNMTLWLDEYSEGRLYAMSTSAYVSTTLSTWTLPIETGGNYGVLAINWTRLVTSTNASFEGDATWLGRQTVYQYNLDEQNGYQYGNLTRAIEYEWNGNGYVAYRAVRMRYYPTDTSSAYLVGLPANQNVFKCPSGNCDMALGNLIASTLYLYDGATSFSTPPTAGKLTGQRTLLYCLNNDCATTTNRRYSDAVFAYDSYGNRTSVTTYTGEGTLSALATQGAQSSYTCYGSGGTLNGLPCTDDGYHTYPRWADNALGQRARMGYDLALSVPIVITDTNNVATTVTYNAFGWLKSVRRPGDETGTATAAINYAGLDLGWSPGANNPYWTEVIQKVNSSTTFTVRKYYNGLGQLLQVQGVGEVLKDKACSPGDGSPDTCDVLVDYYYNDSGSLVRQTVPLTVTTGIKYHASEHNDMTRFASTTSYDVLGRSAAATAPDGSVISYAYGDLSVTVTDARGNAATTYSNVWGQTVKVVPVKGPWTEYEYNTAGQLVKVKQRAEGISGAIFAETMMSYNLAGMKLSMDDPDMGDWSYSYDALGNLKTQVDARGCTTTLSYDLLNRLTGKSYSGAGCGVSTAAVSYFYDEGGAAAYANGRRTRMTDDSGSATWSYDARGRMTSERKTITDAGIFVTQWGYNSADLLAWMNYPGNRGGGSGETVYYNYLPQMAVNSVSGTYLYVQQAQYDAAGRMTMLKLGANLQTEYSYFKWDTPNGAGRLKRIFSTWSGQTKQDMRYYSGSGAPSYDAAGNLLSINDYVAGSPQVQTFSYDRLDRLTSGVASGGTQGNYTQEVYTYTITGTLNIKGGVNFYYTDPAHKHAVTRLSSRAHFAYDANGNMIERALDIGAYSMAYDAESRLVAAGEMPWFRDSFESGNFSAWNLAVTDGGHLTVDTSAALTGTKGMKAYINDNNAMYVEDQSPTSEKYYKVAFYFHPNSISMANNDTYTLLRAFKTDGTDAFDIEHLKNGSGQQQVRARLLQDGTPGTWVSTTAVNITPGSVHTIKVEWKASSAAGANNGAITLTVDSQAPVTLLGKDNDTRIVDTVRWGAVAGIDTGTRGSIYLDGYRGWDTPKTEITYRYDGDNNLVYRKVGTTVTAYVGEHFEWTAVGNTKYYYAAGKRVALMRSGYVGSLNGLFFILSDHLGSTYRLIDGSGAPQYDLLYRPWGKPRVDSGAALPGFKFTGQREGEMGLLWYRSRWYDPQIARWVQADTIVPNAGYPLDFDRYAYVRNSPQKYIDPAGHAICDADGYCPKINSYSIDTYRIEPKIPAPIYYSCLPGIGETCLGAGMDAIDQIVFAVYFEGPSGARSYRDAIRIAANVIQTLLNRAYNYWTCWQSNCAHSWINGKSRTPWEDITAEQLTRLLLFILSESYPGGDGQDYPAYNAWSAPKIIPTTGGAKEVWGAIKAAVQDILAHPGADLLSVVKIPYEDKMWYPNGNLLNRDVMYYGYKEGGFDPRPPGVVWCDEVFRDEKDDQCYGIRPINP